MLINQNFTNEKPSDFVTTNSDGYIFSPFGLGLFLIFSLHYRARAIPCHHSKST